MARALFSPAPGAGISTQSINVGDPRVADQVNAIVAAAPAILAKAGVTPDAAARMIAGQLGKLQAASSATPPATDKAA